MKPMTPADLWFRVGLGVVLMIVGLILQAGTVSIIIFAVGLAWIIWAVIRSVLQVRKAERIQRERRGRTD